MECELHTGDFAISCNLLAALFDPCVPFPGDSFRGSVGAWQRASAWHVAVRGHLAAVELERLVGPAFGHVLTGTSNLDVEMARFEAGRLVDLRARIDAGPGRVSQSLLAAAASLGCATFQPPSTGDVLPYGELALEAEVHRDGKLVFVGRCRDKTGAILTDLAGRPLVVQPPADRQPQSVLNFVRAIGGTAAVTVPATPLAAQLLGWLLTGGAAETEPSTAVRSSPGENRPGRAAALK